MALSAEIGLRIGLLGSFISIITTWACSPTFSLMQMNLSDSIVKVLKPMFAGFIPRFWSWGKKKTKNINHATKWIGKTWYSCVVIITNPLLLLQGQHWQLHYSDSNEAINIMDLLSSNKYGIQLFCYNPAVVTWEV